MRTPFIVVMLCALGLTAGVLWLVKGKNPTPATADVVEVRTEAASSAKELAIETEAIEPVMESIVEQIEATAVEPAQVEVEATVKPALPATPLTREIATLVDPDMSFHEKQGALSELQASGQLDQAIEALEQGARENPDSAAYPAALGQAQLRKAGEIANSGGEISEMGMLGMQADRNFKKALDLDPSNWEAQFFKAAAMSHWPPELNKGEEVVERLSILIDQQDTMMPQPEFAQSYAILGDQYLKMGKPDYAQATWEIGARKFPGDSSLRERLYGQ